MKTCIDCKTPIMYETLLKCEHCRYVDISTLHTQLNMDIELDELILMDDDKIANIVMEYTRKDKPRLIVTKIIKSHNIKIPIILHPPTQEELELIRINKLEKIELRKLAYKEKQKQWRKCHVFQKMTKNFNSKYKTNITPAQLWAIAKKQHRKCALSGIKLTYNNISIDHIVPQSKGGTHTINNLRFVTTRMNSMRSNLNDIEFINLCKQVVQYNNSQKYQI